MQRRVFDFYNIKKRTNPLCENYRKKYTIALVKNILRESGRLDQLIFLKAVNIKVEPNFLEKKKTRSFLKILIEFLYLTIKAGNINSSVHKFINLFNKHLKIRKIISFTEVVVHNKTCSV